MANSTFNIRLLIRSDTEENWNANSTQVLLKNELIFVTNIGEDNETKMKLGDGVKTFAELDYIEMGGAGSVGVESINGQTGIVTLTASDVGALPNDTQYVSSVNGSSGAVTISAGNKTVLSATQPAAGTMNAGDIWYKTL